MVLSVLKIQIRDYKGEFFIVSAWIGILFLALLLLVISLFTSLSLLCFLLLVLIVSVISLYDPSTRNHLKFYTDKLFTPWLAIWTSLVFSLSFLMTAKVVHHDAGLYHFQLTKWLSEFGTVPGLALLHNRFGFTSSWFALSAPFNIDLLSGKTVALTGGLAFLLASSHFILCLNNIFRLPHSYKKHSINWFIIVAIISCLPYLVRHRLAISGSPDTPVAILTIEIAWLIVFISNQINNSNLENISIDGNQIDSNARLLPLILACGVFAIKLSSLPLVLISLAFYCFEKATVKINLLIRGILVITVLVTPVLLVNVVSSGCPLYPSPTFCTDLSWSVGSQEASQNSAIIRDWARWLGPSPENSNNWNWLIHWLPRSKDSLFMIIASVLSSIIFLSIPKKSEIKGRYYILAIAYIGILFLMYKAPSTRFGLGYLLTLPSFVIALILEWKLSLGISLLMMFSFSINFLIVGQWSSPVNSEKIQFMMIIILIIVSIMAFFRKRSQQWIYIPLLTVILILSIIVPNQYYLFQDDESKLDSRLIIPMGIRSLVYPDDFQNSYAINFRYIKPRKGNQCWDSPLPCTPYLTHRNVRLRDEKKGLREGFTLTSDS